MKQSAHDNNRLRFVSKIIKEVMYAGN